MLSILKLDNWRPRSRCLNPDQTKQILLLMLKIKAGKFESAEPMNYASLIVALRIQEPKIQKPSCRSFDARKTFFWAHFILRRRIR